MTIELTNKIVITRSLGRFKPKLLVLYAYLKIFNEIFLKIRLIIRNIITLSH